MEFIDKETIKAMAEAQGQEFDEEAERIRREQIERNYPKAGVVSVRIVDGMFEMYTVGESDESSSDTD